MSDDNPVLLVQEMSAIMAVDLDKNDISIAHRLPPTNKVVKNRLIVKFSRREKRDDNKAQIHVNESLTTYRKRLLGRVLEFKRKHNYKFAWTANGKILLKKMENSSMKCFVTHEEFEEFLHQYD